MTENGSAAGRRGRPGGFGDGGDGPRDFGRDGVSGLLTADRAMRSRDVSRPGPDDVEAAAEVVDRLIARLNGRR